MKFIHTAPKLIAASLLAASVPTIAQTFSNCNPLHSSSCPPDAALGKSIHVDFTKGAVDSFSASGKPTYDSNGVSFTVAKSGDAPTLTSLFYIMFGKVSITMKAAPGAGIVSTVVLQSDDLDEIDLEWLGADGSEVQTNYFGKGDTTTYDRGAFNPAPNNQNEFITYTIEWTAQQVVWSVGGTVVRVLTPATADANQYPQTPMQIKFGAWSGGDPSNSPGTIGWARGPTNYANGPFTMVVNSIDISDYSTGTQYKYTGTSGKWQDIVAVDGKVGANQGSVATSVVVAGDPSATSLSPSIPIGGFGGSSNTPAQTGWPWVPSPTTLSTVVATSSIRGIPSGWTVSTSGKIVPVSTAAPTSSPMLPSSVDPSSSPSLPSSLAPGYEISTGWDSRGFPITMTITPDSGTSPKCYDIHGFATPCSDTTLVAASSTTGNTGGSTIVKGGLAPATTTSSGYSLRQPKNVFIWVGMTFTAVLLII